VQELAVEASTYEDRGFAAPFLTNHDMRRAMRVLDGDADEARLAAAVLLALPGSPFLYYGEELGMRGGAGDGDEHKRTPMRWTEDGGFTTGEPWFASEEPAGVSVAAQTGAPDSLLSWYRRLLAARHASAALQLGDARVPEMSGGGRGAFALVREHDGERVLFLANFHDAPTEPWTITLAGAPEVALERGLDGTPARDGARLVIPSLQGRGFAHVVLR
jgi:glycosidase